MGVAAHLTKSIQTGLLVYSAPVTVHFMVISRDDSAAKDLDAEIIHGVVAAMLTFVLVLSIFVVPVPSNISHFEIVHYAGSPFVKKYVQSF